MRTNHIAAILFAGLAIAGRAPAQTPAPLKVFTAIEVAFGTETNKLYTLQGGAAVDGTQWNDIGDPVFGNGADINAFFSTRHGGEVKFEFYRLAVAESTNTPLAPWSFQGVSIGLDGDGVHNHVDFLTETNGVRVTSSGTEPFAYAFTKTGPNEVQADVNPPSGRRQLYTFDFSAPTLGTYTRDEFRTRVRTYYGVPRFSASELRERRVGTFRVLAGIAGAVPDPGTPPGSVPTAPPASLAGLAYSFVAGGAPDRLEFNSATNGIEIEDHERPGDDNPGKSFTYTYAMDTTNHASLVVTFSAIRRDEYGLTFGDGAQGKFTRREFRNGVADDSVATGSFSPSSIPPAPASGGTGGDDGGGSHGGGHGGSGGGGTTTPAVTAAHDLAGDPYVFLGDAAPLYLVFQTTTDGIEFSATVSTQFSYTYAATATAAAHLSVKVGTDGTDEYELTFTGKKSGTYVRQEMRGGVLARTVSGAFARNGDG